MNTQSVNMPVEAQHTEVVELHGDNTEQFVTFYFDKHFFGLPIDDVIEINKALDITPVPLAPAYVAGVVNLRGQILTAVHLAQKMGLHMESCEAAGPCREGSRPGRRRPRDPSREAPPL